ncbi:methylated-DNA--[protein]-cysteine S-methyltransferase [Streptomyces sp. NPDC048290]|uniref:methylated-DNA--[protein]-cysteine S-methyltransferase n=1 Tax=Streptomyces sp. NPDC048290 TaxID=3155811 RepID=UPI0034496AFC
MTKTTRATETAEITKTMGAMGVTGATESKATPGTTKHTVVATPLGPVTVVASGDAITGLYFAHHIRRPAQETFGVEVPPDETDGPLAEAVAQLTDYLAGRRRGFDLPLDAAGNAFQHRVWAKVAAIPFGETTTYGTLAERLGDRSLAYQVGQAVGANPLCVFVPCHRVVGANGSLTGYAGGLRRKRALLELEEPVQAAAGRLF